TVIIVIHLMVVSAMIGVVLLQKSEGGGLGIGGGGGGGVLSGRRTANVPTRATAILGATFLAPRIVLSLLAGWHRKPKAIIQNTGGQTQQTPGGSPGQGGVLDTLRQQEQSAPPAPSGPQVPRSQ